MAVNPEDYGLGRRALHDPRDKNFPVLAMIQAKEVLRSYRNWNANGWWGDQTNTPQCVGYSLAHMLADGPVTHKGTKPPVPPQAIYNEAQKVDEWEGENYDGTSVRAGAKWLQQKGYISEYRWAWDEPTLAKFILTTGPAVIGIYWYESMFEPDEKGLIEIDGYIAGGHAIKVDGYNDKTGLYRLKQSWGRAWGKNGFCYVHKNTMARLIAEDGEICLPIENKVIPTFP